MSIIEKMSKIVNEGDAAGADQLIHDDYQFLMHSSGTVSYTHLTLPTKA